MSWWGDWALQDSCPIHPSVCCSGSSTQCLAAGEAWPGARSNWSTTDLLCLSKDANASMRQRREGRNFQLPWCAGTCQMPGSPQELGTSWQRQEERQLYFPMASQGSTTLLGLFYYKKVLHFAYFYVCTAEHEPPLGKITTRHNQPLRHSGYNCSSKLKWSRAWIPSLALKHLHCLTADVFIGAASICANSFRQCQEMFWCWGIFTIDEVPSILGEDSFLIQL